MKFSTALPLTFVLSFLSVALATYSKEDAQRLVDQIDTPLKQGNEKLIKTAINMMATNYSTCQPNVCFALDGSGSITERQFELQKGFVLLATAVLGGLFEPSGQYAAVEYGSVIDVISRLTTNLDAFLITVNGATSQQAPLTFVAPALQFCITEFRRSPQALNKIVLLGDGQSTFADTGPFGAIRIARRFRKKSTNSICAGLVGRGNADFFTSITGDRNLVLRRRNWENIIDIIIDLVEEVCGPSP